MIGTFPFRIREIRTNNGHEFQAKFHWHVEDKGVHASIHNHFNLERHLSRRHIFKQNRAAAMAEWHQLAA